MSNISLFTKKAFSKQSLKKFFINLLWFLSPLFMLILTGYILLAQKIDLDIDTYEKETQFINSVSAVIGFILAFLLFIFDGLPKRYSWLCFCFGLLVLFVGMFFHISIWILLAVVIVMISPIYYFCDGKSVSWNNLALSLFFGLICAYGSYALISRTGEKRAYVKEAYREYEKNPDSYPKTVIRDIRKSEIYTDEYGITSFSAKCYNGLKNIQEGDTVQLAVNGGKIFCVLSNSRIKNTNN